MSTGNSIEKLRNIKNRLFTQYLRARPAKRSQPSEEQRQQGGADEERNRLKREVQR